MGRYNFRAQRVREGAARLAQASSTSSSLKSLPPTIPPWFEVMGRIPPAQTVVRTQPIRHQPALEAPNSRRSSRAFIPHQIKYEEDKLRKHFFQDHPWELARPTVVLENDGTNNKNHDWSHLRQPGRRIDGESVIQRQLWLINNQPGMTPAKAYDQARKEFYMFRLQEDVERNVAEEEALATGAYFGPSYLDIGMKIEDQSYESWRAWAAREVQKVDQRKSAATIGSGDDTPDDEMSAMDQDVILDNPDDVAVVPGVPAQ